MSEPAIRVRELGKRYRLWSGDQPTTLSDHVARLTDRLRHRQHIEHHPRRSEIWALRDVSFDVAPGEVLGVIGPNGAGKSTLLSILARITEPTEGMAEINGRVNALLEVGTGFHPELSGRDNVFLNGAILGMSRAETASKFDEIVEFAGVGEFIDVPVKRYSSGMYVRLAFSVAVHLDPEVLLLDEVLAVGDRAFQEKCLTRIQEMTNSGRAVLFVSHDPTSVVRLCHRAIVINEGRIVFDGNPQGAVERYLTSRTLDGGDVGGDPSAVGGNKLQVTAVRVSAPVISGKSATLDVEIASRRPFDASHTTLDLRILGEDGVGYVGLPVHLEGVLDRLELRCTIDELPLSSGSYVVSTYLVEAGEVLHHLPRATTFSVVPDEAHGPDRAGGFHPPVVVRHAWTTVTAAERLVVGIDA